MEKIKQKIAELMSLSKLETKGWDALKAKIKAQDALMDELRELAKEHNTPLGRIIKFPCGDGYAIYIITKVNKKSVKIEWINYGDGWVDKRCGYGGTLNIDYAIYEIKHEDTLRSIFK